MRFCFWATASPGPFRLACLQPHRLKNVLVHTISWKYSPLRSVQARSRIQRWSRACFGRTHRTANCPEVQLKPANGQRLSGRNRAFHNLQSCLSCAERKVTSGLLFSFFNPDRGAVLSLTDVIRMGGFESRTGETGQRSICCLQAYRHQRHGSPE